MQMRNISDIITIKTGWIYEVRYVIKSPEQYNFNITSRCYEIIYISRHNML
jgi:hypothetical protein